MSFFAPVQVGVMGIAGMVLDWLNIAVVFAILYMLFQLATNGTLGGKNGLWGGGGGSGGGGSGGGGDERPPRPPREGEERTLPPGIPQNVIHEWDRPNGRYLLAWDARPGDENVVEYQIQRREAPRLRNLGTRRFLTGNLVGGWQTIGRSTTPEFIDSGSSHRWRINPRNLTYPGNRRVRQNLMYQYRVRAINRNNQKGSWGHSRPRTRGPNYIVRPHINFVQPNGPVIWFRPVATRVSGDIVVDTGDATGYRFRLEWWSFPLTERRFVDSMVSGGLSSAGARAHHGVLHRWNNFTAPYTDNAVLNTLDYNTIIGHIVCLGLFDPTTNDWLWDQREIPPHAPIIVIPGMIRGGIPRIP